MFTDWLLRNTDSGGATGKAAKLAWNEINNGIVPKGEYGLLYWRKHLQRRLGAERGDEVFKDFILAYMDFKNEGY